ncbi:MAG TPA: tRNA preQ1(34) S-adenosylmethionine ribosyltransferase-isomerase QueA [Bacteriovoracaceae bacterium]|nr:tRNA preQ1(34) S-adenosylmethionine ribosyltransferase-isomerase QueA [Bacteriovoracaceae bacterium]
MTDFDLKSYDFELPQGLIADRPVSDRHSSKLMVFDESTGKVTHSTFNKLADFLPAHSTLVFNRSRVFPCRLIGRKSSGGEAEVFLLSLVQKDGLYPAMVRAAGKRKVGDEFLFAGLTVQIESIPGDGTFLVSTSLGLAELLPVLEEIGKIPIPPYIRGGESDEQDKLNYQTVFARETGSVAAPTAGLHFSQALLDDLAKAGHELSTVTLHVGAGTFAPVKSDNILDHKMHEELFSIDEENLKKIQSATFKIAVGTTSLRTLESAWDGEKVSRVAGATSIFLHPGKSVHSIDALVTNFHLPKSSLLMLVSALIGREKVLELYKEAVAKKYRFFSYGDGMLILRRRR